MAQTTPAPTGREGVSGAAIGGGDSVSVMASESNLEVKDEFRIVSVPHCPKPVARGLWWFYTTHGVPLSSQFANLLDNHGLYPDWAYLCVELAGNGWPDERVYQYLEGELGGVYAPTVAEKIREGLKRLLKQ
jgi:hypothetical protein